MPLFQHKSSKLTTRILNPRQFTEDLDNVTEKMLKDVNKAIRAGLIDTRNYQRDNHRWKHRTKTLYHGHKVEQVHDGKFRSGWVIMANPYIAPQIDPETGERKIVREDYAHRLESWPKYAWFEIGYQIMYPKLMDKVHNAIKKNLK
jgi:hypothetical protein